ncbi:PREDICTED: Ig heavy chain Mem5-like [Miniopterus natalensis]|uniref:Ig heavy chain Mem5-like n=1 Tax=Miniopterus natalensis TaxID=291302 RepID=UPI0007A6A6D5|nr:PREDICTED: Ig heavy chain Mem5-like [Miniopterus natalensis]
MIKLKNPHKKGCSVILCMKEESQAQPGLNMGVPSQLFCLLFLLPAASRSTVLSQSPAFLSVSLRESVSMVCRADQSISDYLTWYQQKPGQAPKPLIYDADNRYTGVPEKFIGIQYGTEFILKISEVEADDVATYYCQQDYTVPWITFGPGTRLEIKRAVAKPSVSIFPPSAQQLSGGNASVVCLLSRFYPREVSVRWKVDGVVQTQGIQSSASEQDSRDRTYSLSSTLTLPSSEYRSHAVYACEVSHQGLGAAFVKSFNREEC